MTSSIDGLVSGLSTSSLISSLMQVEAAPQTRLKTKVTGAETVVTSYQSVNSKLSALKNAAADVAQLNTWRAVKPTVSSAAVTATASSAGAATTGSVTFDVTKLASAQIQTVKFPSAPNVTVGTNTYGAPVTAVTEFSITSGTGDPVTITLGDDKSPQGIAEAINAKSTSVRATVLTTGDNEKILQLRSTKSGTANAFTIADLSLQDPNTQAPVALTEEAAAVDAEVYVNVAGGYKLTSPTNTFTNVMPGVTVTATKLENGITLDSTPDVTAITAKFQALVDAANAALTEVDDQTAYDPATKKGAPLSGDYAARQIGSTLLSTISQGLGKLDAADTDAFGSLSKLGIQLDRTGKLTFNANELTKNYNENPELIKKAGMAFGESLGEVTKTQTRNVTAAITGRKSLIESMNDQIDEWGVRLTARQEALQKQYATLETSLSKLKSQSTWLSGQIASLG